MYLSILCSHSQGVLFNPSCMFWGLSRSPAIRNRVLNRSPCHFCMCHHLGWCPDLLVPSANFVLGLALTTKSCDLLFTAVLCSARYKILHFSLTRNLLDSHSLRCSEINLYHLSQINVPSVPVPSFLKPNSHTF